MNEQSRDKKPDAPKPRGTIWQCCVCGQQYLIEEYESLDDFVCSICTHLNSLVPAEDD